jgi:hypothetical protein
MKGDVTHILVLALIAALYPALLAAVTVMLLQPSPRRLMLGYLLGAYATSITLGLVIVFALQSSGAAEHAKRTVSPGQDIAIGLLLLLAALVLATGRDERLRRARQRRKDAKRKSQSAREPWSQRLMGRGSARITFVIGLVLTFPGVTYLTALHDIARLDAAAEAKAAVVVAFCLVQLFLLEAPLLSYTFAPDRTRDAVSAFRAWLTRRGRHFGIIGAALLGAVLVVRGMVDLL